jgi:hypothetical protein
MRTALARGRLRCLSAPTLDPESWPRSSESPSVRLATPSRPVGQCRAGRHRHSKTLMRAREPRHSVAAARASGELSLGLRFPEQASMAVVVLREAMAGRYR